MHVRNSWRSGLTPANRIRDFVNCEIVKGTWGAQAATGEKVLNEKDRFSRETVDVL